MNALVMAWRMNNRLQSESLCTTLPTSPFLSSELARPIDSGSRLPRITWKNSSNFTSNAISGA